MLIPAIFAFVRLPNFKDHGRWLTDDRQMLALLLLRYALILVRRADPDLSAYSRDVLKRADNVSSEPPTASSV
jgi:hypothetical protein